MSTLASAVQDKLERRQRAKTDKLFLATEVLGYDFQPDVHTELFDNYLQIDPAKSLVEQDAQKDRLVLWSRGHYKTTSIVVEIVQLILNFPDIRILLMQGTIKNTKGLLREIKSHFSGEAQNSKLNDLFPEFAPVRRGGPEAFTVQARQRRNLPQETVTVASPRAVKAGQHYEAGFFDDLIHEQNFRNSDLVQKAIADFNHYIPLIDPGGYRYVTGTRYIFGDLYEWIIRHNEGNWKISIRECWTVNADGSKTILFPQRKIADGRTIGFTLEMLEQIQRDDPEMFAAQYLNRPISTASQIFTEQLILTHVRSANEENFPTLGNKFLFVDLAASKTDQADHSVIICGQADALGRMYVTDARGDRYTPLQLANTIIEMEVKHRALRILIEETAAGRYFAEYLRIVGRDRGLNLPIDFIKVSNTKDAKYVRISSVEGVLKNNRLFFLAGLPRWEMILEQFTQFPRSRHDDYPDTISLMVQWFHANVARRPLPTGITAHPVLQQMFATQEPAANNFLTTTPAFSDGSMGADFAD